MHVVVLTHSKPKNVRRGRQRSDEILSRRGVISLPRRFIFPLFLRVLFVILTPALQRASLHYEIKYEDPGGGEGIRQFPLSRH